MELIKRNRCAVTGARDLEPLYTFKRFPVFMGCTKEPEALDLKADMAWAISGSSGVIQLKSLLPLDVLYCAAHGAGCVGSMWQKHHRAFALHLRQFKWSSVFEIGGSHGILAKEYDGTGRFPWTILDPNPAPVSGSPARFINGFFDAGFKYSGPFDAVVLSHVLEHAYSPDDLMAQLAGFMKTGTTLALSIPNMRVWLERMYTSCLNFEHTALLTEPYVEYLLSKHGFRFEGKKYFMEDHSIFYTAVRDAVVRTTALPGGLYEAHKKLYGEYLRHHSNLTKELNAKTLAADRPVYLFGAHIFAQALIAFGLDTDRIACLLDNDPGKQGKRLYGTNLTVNSPKILAGIKRPAVILKAGVYNHEIKEDILSTINRNTIFWE